VSFSGNLGTMPFADLLQWVAQSRKSGTLTVSGSSRNKKVYFREGHIVAAASDNPREFLSYYLVGWSYVGEEELQELLDMQKRHDTMLGELLLIVGRLSRDELSYILQVQTEEMIYELFLWEEGEFRFLENILPAMKFQPTDLPVDNLILEGVRRKDEWGVIRKKISDKTCIPKLVRAVDVQQVGESELGILREINDTNSVEEIALSCRLAFFPVLEYVYQGTQAGLFTIREPRKDEDKSKIPGFGQGAWRMELQKVAELIAKGELKEGYRELKELGVKHEKQSKLQERVAEIQKTIDGKLEEAGVKPVAVLELAIPPAKLTSLTCSPEEGFLLSRVNGMYTIGEICTMIPGSQLEVCLMVFELMRRQVLKFKGPMSTAGPKQLRAVD